MTRPTLAEAGPAEPRPYACHPYEIVYGDVCDGGLLTAVIPGHDLAVGLAAKTRVDRSIEGSDTFVQTNVLGTQALPQARPEAGAAGGVRRRGRR